MPEALENPGTALYSNVRGYLSPFVEVFHFI